MGYFNYFRRADYILSDSLAKKVTDLSQYTGIFSMSADDISFYTYYTMRGDERLDTISNELYGSPNYYWTIPLLNTDMINIWNDLYKDEASFQAYLKSKYPGFALIIDPEYDLVGSFRIGETVAYDVNNVLEIVGKFPSRRYLHGVPISMDRFDVLNDPKEVWVLLTGKWNEVNDNYWDDTSIWRDTTEWVIGQDNLDILKVESAIPAHKAPAYFEDSNGNTVPWYREDAFPVTIEDIERQKNETNAKLKVIKPQYIYDVATRFEREMKRISVA